MAEEVAEVEVGGDVAPETQVEEVAVETNEETPYSDSFINSITDETLKSAPLWDRLKGKSADELAQYIKETQAYNGKKGDIPKEDASPEAIAEFYGKLGTPNNSDGYETTISDEFRETVGDEMAQMYEAQVKGFADVAHPLHLTEAQHAGVLDYYMTTAAEEQIAQKAELDKQSEANEAALSKEWGDGKEAINLSIEAMLKNNGMSAEQVAWAKEAGILSEPALAIPLAKISAKFADDPEIGHHHTQSQEGVQDQIMDIQMQMSGLMSEGKSIPPQLKQKLNSLFAKVK